MNGLVLLQSYGILHDGVGGAGTNINHDAGKII